MIPAYDIETLSTCFTCVAIDIKTKQKWEFVIHESRNDLKAFAEFVKSTDGMIGFNSVGFDYAVIHPFITDPKYLSMTGDKVAKLIYKRSQKIIEEEKQKEWIKPIVPQRDLFLIYHFKNKARATSLKWLQICMGWRNVQEMPIHHTTKVTKDMIPTILEYNTNDVETTIEFYNRSKDRISFRKTLTEKYGVDFGNFSDNKIGEFIFLNGISELTGHSIGTLKKIKGTFRSKIPVREFLVPLDFSTPQFAMMYDKFLAMEITATKKKKKEKYVCIMDDVTYEFGFGGLHGFRSPGTYHNIDSADVSSYYPNLAIGLRIYPPHLGQTFCQVNEKLYNDRKLFPKGSAENAAYKLALNGVIGMMNSEWSPFFSRASNMAVTINGQFLLAMLCERITESLAGKIVMANTDGIEVDVTDDCEFKRICQEWQDEFKLPLEFSKYKVLCTRDINNYIAVLDGKKTKEKGDFEVEKEIHKSQSMRIVPIAVRMYFTAGVSVEQTINQCNDISLFLLGHRAKTGNLRYRGVEGYDLTDEKLPKNVRYYISKSGGAIVKITKQEKKVKNDISPNQTSMFDVGVLEKQQIDKVTKLHVGYRMTLFNKWIDKPFEDYGIEKRFYINEARKLIDSVVHKQVTI